MEDGFDKKLLVLLQIIFEKVIEIDNHFKNAVQELTRKNQLLTW
jgi:hypothetical protein